jgi:streptogramin lyase
MRGLKTIVAIAVPLLGGMLSGQAAAADTTCTATRGAGVACLNGSGEWTFFTRKGKQLRSNTARDMAVCNGKIYIADGRAVLSYDGEKLSAPNPLPQGYIRRLACAGDGYIVSTSRTIGLWNGSGWKFWSAQNLLKDEKYKSISDVAMDKDGTIWFVAFGGIAGRIKGDAVKIWKKDQGFDRRLVLSHVIADKEGKIYVPQYRGLYTPDGDNWKLVAGPGGSNVFVAPDGALWLTRGRRINRFMNNSWKSFRIDHSTRAVAVDSTGRVWAATEYGLAVGKDGKWEWRQMHNSDLPDNSLRYIAVLGKGGTLPAPKEQKNGSLRGRMEWYKSGEPVKGATVQICGISKGLLSRSPCAGQPHAKSTTTDDEGRFAFKDVAPASYRIAAKFGDKWVRIFLSYNRAHVLPGQNKNTGTIRVRERFRPK